MSRLLSLLLLLPVAACSPSAAPENSATTPAAAELTSMERGAILWKRCRACHTLEADARHKVGPNLWGVFGQPAGAREDFNYSRAMRAADIVWDDATMNAYLEKPAAYIPGNRMTYAGLRKLEDRAAVIEYLKAQTGASEDTE